MTQQKPNERPQQDTVIRCVASEGFARWMAGAGGSLLLTTYQAGKVVLVGWDGRQVSVLMRQFDKPMGVAVSGNRLALATRHEVTVFADASLLAPDYAQQQGGSGAGGGAYDALYLPRVTYHTGDLAMHDLAFAPDGLWAVNTRFSCLCRLGEEYSFVPAWQPPFVTELAPEDRCHLNGMALVGGKPAYVTALGETDSPGAWREKKASGGVILDVATGQAVVRGLSMPHSPRWHDGRLWVLNSGTGELCQADPASGKSTVICALPGYLRGLAFAGKYAVVGLCQIREKHLFGGLPVQERHAKLKCGAAVVDLESGKEVGLLEFTAGCQELYDAHFLPGVRRGNILNLSRDAARHGVTAPAFSYWMRPDPSGGQKRG